MGMGKKRIKSGRTIVSQEALSLPPKWLPSFWEIQGPILEHYKKKKKQQIANNATYSAMLKGKLKPAIHNRRRGQHSKRFLSRQNKAQHHVTALTTETVRKLTSELQPHPPCLLLTKGALRGHRLGCDEKCDRMGA
jgi:hypothetical protein